MDKLMELIEKHLTIAYQEGVDTNRHPSGVATQYHSITVDNAYREIKEFIDAEKSE